MNSTVIVYNTLALAFVLGAIAFLWRLKTQLTFFHVFILGVTLVALTFVGAFFSPIDAFGKSQMLCWALFVHHPIFLIGVTIVARRRNRKSLSGLSAVLTICTVLVGVYAFLIEPHWLKTTRVTIRTDKLASPIRLAVIADVQTDRPGKYEQHVFELVADEHPDLILFAGDYLHISDEDDYLAAKEKLNALLLRAGLEAPLGMYAVRGNVDWGDWDEIFAGTPVVPIEVTSTRNLGPVVLTGMTLTDSGNPGFSLPGQAKYHIAVGHKPDYSLGEVNADLLIAGHTHGGQVRLPLIGPIFTLSRVPRAWAAGITQIAPGQYLIVSRGIGMERGNAPRLRFLCRPELLIVDLLPLE
ncbi:MAG: metallophosphoesterase [Anaerolineales bacterium]